MDYMIKIIIGIMVFIMETICVFVDAYTDGKYGYVFNGTFIFCLIRTLMEVSGCT